MTSNGSTAAGGLLIIDKPQGVTSFDAVAAVRAALHTKKVGHAGTLDPMATGMLVIGFGNATRLLTAIVEHDKSYEATIRLGQRTTTDDAEGELIEPEGGAVGTADVANRVDALSRELIEETIREHFTGDIEQVPNSFSAIKINGQRAYDLAREGKTVELKARPVTIGEFTVLGMRSDTAVDGGSDASMPVVDVDVRVSCSSGTYIRALARDLGERLGVGGHLTRLRRTRVGRFDFADEAVARRAIGAHAESYSFTNREGETVTRNKCMLDTPELAGDQRREWLLSRALNMAEAVRGAMPVMEITAEEAAELRFGRRIHRHLETDQAAAVVADTQDVVALIAPANSTQVKPVTVFAAA
ncbi:tRNA pseudouridine(55) synthase TruB [Bifidobacterium eulemuris]|uniref:tRNA pseudouridine synthase B n=1 Tax=Bifidobacterium eulemuris TaxID=1765219 RepID=A0A261G9A0_9BIFI|nr:tRNA pseudouridine(55) synthase TruB [Bifidobacterium eulemuris]OZG68007.1 tRNA pseudouridine synthase B [Bifidobacterium eulemuris]QOL31914.1 tRNA pseudouridine(55) synthase TruB [Bifidobacterium eulemuris]